MTIGLLLLLLYDGMTWLARGSAKVEQRRSSPCKSLINKEHGQPPTPYPERGNPYYK